MRRDVAFPLGPPVDLLKDGGSGLGVTGVYVGRLRRTLAEGPRDDARPAPLLFASAGVSQACWWTAVAVGFLSSQG